jgi:NAD(P)-dependent dehydrogenase (short-subunit alcohol dehydrogenase family)
MTKVALIWGAAGGIGRALARRLKEEGWQVIGVCRQGDDLAGVADYAFAADVADPFAVQRAALAAGQEAGEAHLFVYAAGDIAAEPAARMTPATFRRIMDANRLGAYNAVHHSLPLLAADAPLVFLGAVSERMRLPGLSAYAAAKAGLSPWATRSRRGAGRRCPGLLAG